MASDVIDLGFTPYEHQATAHERAKRFNVLVWHRRSGKTVFAVIKLILGALLTSKERAMFAYVAPFYRQAKAVAWDYAKAFARKVPGAEILEAELTIRFPNGARVRLFGADNPDALRGLYFDGIVIDEVADMRPQVWGEIVRPALADRNGWAIFIGTPKGTNLLSSIYYDALQSEEWFADLKRADDTGVIAADELARMRQQMTPSQWAQEMECDFSAAVDNVLIAVQVAVDASRRPLDRREFEGEAKIIGVDVARYGDDRSVAFTRQGRCASPPKVWRGLDLMTLSSYVAALIDTEKPDAVFVDQTGMGAGVVDRLVQLGYRRVVIGVEFGGKPADEHFANKRAEMWWRLAEWVKTAKIPQDPALIAELTAPTYTYANAAGRLQLESKEDMKERVGRQIGSPDLADALALTFAEPVAPPGMRGVMRFKVRSALGR